MSANNSHMVELRDVQKEFEDKKVLDGVSLTVEPGERLVIMGQSGSGKSTILRLILGILKPDSGSVFFKQFEITRLKRRKLKTPQRPPERAIVGRASSGSHAWRAGGLRLWKALAR